MGELANNFQTLSCQFKCFYVLISHSTVRYISVSLDPKLGLDIIANKSFRFGWVVTANFDIFIFVANTFEARQAYSTKTLIIVTRLFKT